MDRPSSQPPTLTATALVVGLGKTGLSCIRLLKSCGIEIMAADSRNHPPGLPYLREHWPEVPVFLGEFDAKLFIGSECLVVSPGVSLQHPAVMQAIAHGVPVMGDIELFARVNRAPVVAITGSNGKSTVTTLVGEMAREAHLNVRVGGNLGIPTLDLFDVPGDPPDLYVLELSSFQLETTFSLRPAVSVVLNVSPDHLDRYPSMTEYIDSKRSIYRDAEIAVINRDDPVVAAMAPTVPIIRHYGLSAPEKESDYGVLCHEGKEWLARGEQRLLPVERIALKGRHNFSNTLAALALAEAVGLPWPPIEKTLGHFSGLPHRTQWVATHQSVHWYNDSKGTNVGATIAAIEGLEGTIILIAGGEGKGQDFAPLRPVVANKCRAVVLMGRDTPLLQSALHGLELPVITVKDMQDAVATAMALAQPGDSVLLSPACASFDMFANYEKRGEQFVDAVHVCLTQQSL